MRLCFVLFFYPLMTCKACVKLFLRVFYLTLFWAFKIRYEDTVIEKKKKFTIIFHHCVKENIVNDGSVM